LNLTHLPVETVLLIAKEGGDPDRVLENVAETETGIGIGIGIEIEIEIETVVVDGADLDLGAEGAEEEVVMVEWAFQSQALL